MFKAFIPPLKQRAFPLFIVNSLVKKDIDGGIYYLNYSTSGLSSGH